ncbi:rhodanese-like domain-containing protein [Luteimonas mephitis]|jgi:monothiol glutaredoxin|uniref:rhodanese-like domain-containing protein n=1 Tax=Luteimonas mephitis TaxID=83615 RepID=UPI0003FDA6EA|nr:rhodanese-like domain-containing protein [Luteimonas mephitis]
MTTGTRDLSPAEAAARVRDGSLTIVDVRPPEERELAAIALPYAVLEAGGLEELLALPSDLPLGFLCHHGGRSAQAAGHFGARGFTEVFNIVGGIDAWAQDVDPSVPRY